MLTWLLLLYLRLRHSEACFKMHYKNTECTCVISGKTTGVSDTEVFVGEDIGRRLE